MTTSPAHTLTRRTALASAAGLILGGCTFGGSTPDPLAAIDVRPYPDALSADLHVDPGTLSALLHTNECDRARVLDVRPIRDFEAGHIRGARHAWWQDTIERNLDWYGGVLRPDDETGAQTRRQAVLDLWGLSTIRRVVVYDDHASIEAARVIWFLSFLGFPRVSLLDGGYAAWLAADPDIPDDSGDISICVASPTIAPRDGYYLVFEQVQARLSEGGAVLLDIRTEAELRDDVDGTVRPGKFPSAIEWPHDELLDSGMRLLPAAELSARAASLGLDPAQRVILVGRVATDCALSWLALQLIGFPSVPTYDGGWMDWSTRPDAPVVWL